MMYRAYLKETGEILECESFRNIYRWSMQLMKDWCYSSREVGVIHITKCDEIVDWRDDLGYLHSEVINEQHVCFIAVSSTGYTIDYGNVIMTVDKDCWSINRW